MKYIYTMQNLTFGSDGGLTAACEAKHPTEPHLYGNFGTILYHL